MFYVIQHGERDYVNGIFPSQGEANDFAEETRYQEQTGNYIVSATNESEALQLAKGKYTDYCGS